MKFSPDVFLWNISNKWKFIKDVLGCNRKLKLHFFLLWSATAFKKWRNDLLGIISLVLSRSLQHPGAYISKPNPEESDLSNIFAIITNQINLEWSKKSINKIKCLTSSLHRRSHPFRTSSFTTSICPLKEARWIGLHF